MLVILVVCGYLSLIDRRVMATVHLRTGPGIGYLTSLLLPICDGVKLLLKNFPFNGVYLGFLFLIFVNFV